MKYRIVQYALDQYCAQEKIGFFYSWEPLDKFNPSITVAKDRFVRPFQAIVPTFEEAEKIIENRKEWREITNPYPKIYKIK
jgi:hypothetical protein